MLGTRASSAFVEDAAAIFLTLLLSYNDDTTVPTTIVSQFKTERVSQSAKVLACI